MTASHESLPADPAPLLFRAGRVVSPADPRATALLVKDGRVAWLGPAEDAPAAPRTVDLGDALVAPAFVDAHVHATDTGITLLGLDLTGCRSVAEVLDAVRARAAALPGDAVVVGNGWDESFWPVKRAPAREELDVAGGGRRVYLSQKSVHSALASATLLAAVPDLAGVTGYDPSGWLRLDAHHRVREIALGAITPIQRREAQRTTLREAAALGIAAVHECGGPGTSSEDDFLALLALPAEGDVPEVYGYWGELGAAEKAKDLGAIGAGGDLYADGAIGSHTAYLRSSYVDVATSGYPYVTAEQVADHLVGCVRYGVQGGFHAIGDAAISTVLAGYAAAAARVGLDRLRAGRHRIEHLEILDRELIRALVEHNVTASLQPAFDRLWGGEDKMYAHRLGVDRAMASNPIAALAGVGVALAFGSDSPVTPLDPWGSVRAAVAHHNPASRISLKAAFAAHTRGGWRAVHRDDEGVLAPGAPATFAVWDVSGPLSGGLPALLAAAPDEPVPPLPVCRRTVLRGRAIYDVEET